MKLVILIGCLLAFAGLYVYFIVEIWNVSGNEPPALNDQLVYVASVLGGVLGAFFAVSLGIQRKDPTIDQRELKLGVTLIGDDKPVGTGLATAAVWLYAIVGLAAGVTAIFKSGQSPDAIKALAATFGGYVLAVFGAAFGGTTNG